MAPEKGKPMTKQRFLTIFLIVFGILIVVFFGMRVMHIFKRMHGHGPFDGKPPAANQYDAGLIRDWMTVPYIAETYRVPPEALFKSLDIPPEKKNGKKSLAELNEEYYPDQPGAVLNQTIAAIQSFQKQEPPPHFPAIPVFTPTVKP